MQSVTTELAINHLPRWIYYQTDALCLVVLPKTDIRLKSECLKNAESLLLIGLVNLAVVYTVQLMDSEQSKVDPFSCARECFQTRELVLLLWLLFDRLHYKL